MSLVRIDELFKYEKGTLQSSKSINGKYDFITAAEKWKTHKDYSHECEALIFAAAASGSLGRTHYINGKFITSDLCFLLTPKDKSKYPVDLKFYQIIFQNYKDDIVKNTKAGTSKEAIGLKNFGNYKLPYYDIGIQKEIRKKFQSSGVLKNELEKHHSCQLDLRKKLRQQILQDAVQGKLVPQDPNDEPASKLLERIKTEKEQLIREKKIKKGKPLPEIKPEELPFEIPAKWVWCRLGEMVFSYQNGISKRSALVGDKVIVLRLADILIGKISLADTREINLTKKEFDKYKLLKDDILVTRVNGSIDIVGNFTLIDNSDANMTVCDHFIRMRLNNKIIVSKFIHFIGKTRYVRNIIQTKFKTTSGQKTINQGHLDNILIPIPPLQEQLRIVKKIEQLMTLCDELEQSIHQNQKYTQELLKVALKEALEPKPSVIYGAEKT